MFDEFNNILENDGPVKILITTQLKPPVKSYAFLRELMMVFHNVAYYPRRDMKLEDIYTYAKNLNFTHVMVLRFSNGWELLVRHLEGMLAVFKITSVEYQKQIKHHAVATEHVPELILNNFDSKVGVRVGRLLASLFPQQP
jgi:ribosome production factor 1